MNSGVLVALLCVPLTVSASDACSSRQDQPLRQGASLIQTLGTVTNIHRAPTESPELSAFDKDYIHDGNNPLDAYYASELDANDKDYLTDANNPLDADSTMESGSPLKSSVPASQPSTAQRQPASAGKVFPQSMDAWEQDLVVNGKGGDSFEDVRIASSSQDWGSMRIQRAPDACVTREDPQAQHVAYTTAPAGTPCVFGVDDRDEGSHCIMSGGAYGTFGWCFTSAARDTFGSCSSSCPLFGPAKLLGDKIDSLDTSVREHQAWERWIATSTTSTTSATSTTQATKAAVKATTTTTTKAATAATTTKTSTALANATTGVKAAAVASNTISDNKVWANVSDANETSVQGAAQGSAGGDAQSSVDAAAQSSADDDSKTL